MKHLYILHRRRKRKRTVLAVVMVVVTMSGLAVIGQRLLQTETVIGPAPAAVTRHVNDVKSKTKLMETAQYSLRLPADWEQYQATSVITGETNWRNTASNKGTQRLTVYVNAPVEQLAVNRTLSVTPTTTGFVINGDVSDNCIQFTTPESQASGAASGKVRAKWQSGDFWCDVGNRVRNVVGIADQGSDNSIALVGGSGRQRVFITYNDSANSPDFSPMLSAVGSFKLK